MPFIYKENNSRPDKTGAHCDFAPSNKTLWCPLQRNESIHTKVFPLIPYPWSLHFRSSWGGVSKAFSKSNMNVSTWHPASKIIAPIIYYCDQLGFTATFFPESRSHREKKRDQFDHSGKAFILHGIELFLAYILVRESSSKCISRFSNISHY